MSDTFFNGRSWRKYVGEQELKFLEALWTRAGGASTPAQDLGELVTTVTAIEQSYNQANAEMNRLRLIISSSQDKEAGMAGVIKKLEHRISQLEDSL